MLAGVAFSTSGAMQSIRRASCLMPNVCEKSQDAIFNPDERWVDRPALIGLLLEEFSALGGTIASIGLGASRSQATVNQ